VNAERPESALRRNSRLVRRLVTLGSAAMLLIGIALLYMLMQATNNQALYEQDYAQLFVLNVVVAGVLFAAIAWIGLRLYQRWRAGRFGTRLLTKLALIFVLVGLVPGLLIYGVSYQFVSRSIETWFDVKVEGALQAGLSLGRVTLETLASDLSLKARTAAVALDDPNQGPAELQLEKALEVLGASDVALWSGSGRLLGSAGDSRLQLNPPAPSAAQLRLARMERSTYWIEGLEDSNSGATEAPAARIKVLASLGHSVAAGGEGARYLLVTRTLPRTLVANAWAVERANREYQERALGREGLKRMYIGTLTLSLFLAVFAAVLMAVVLGNQIARPLLLLTEGVSQVAAGDLRPKEAMQGQDELGGLTRAFALMTQQLSDARETAQTSMAQLDAARGNLQTILDNLTAGVVVLDGDGRVRQSNPGASRILQCALTEYQGRLLSEIPALAHFGAEVERQFLDFRARRAETAADHWQHTLALGQQETGMHSGAAEQTTLVLRGADLPGQACLLVFDDVSHIVTAQRLQAWGEVARRLAHEIKNPLTPIQLSAERLERRLDGKLAAPEQQVLSKSVKTIVDQVDSMKRLVNEFRDFGRLPAAELQPLDLNGLVQEVLQLYEAAVVPIALDLDPACPPVLGDAQQLRQVIHNLLQNAQDAQEAHAQKSSPGAADEPILVRTYFSASANRVRLTVLDHGGGFAPGILQRAFEPYVTSKSRGTGLGLAVVKKIADDHGARIDISNRMHDGVPYGAQVSLAFKTALLPSTSPSLPAAAQPLSVV
jgi:nitrogen fixation/metabolism regulation signal transduction histidine kinase